MKSIEQRIKDLETITNNLSKTIQLMQQPKQDNLPIPTNDLYNTKYIPVNIYYSINTILKYLLDSEYNHYQECSKEEKSNHIYMHTETVLNWLNTMSVKIE